MKCPGGSFASVRWQPEVLPNVVPLELPGGPLEVRPIFLQALVVCGDGHKLWKAYRNTLKSVLLKLSWSLSSGRHVYIFFKVLDFPLLSFKHVFFSAYCFFPPFLNIRIRTIVWIYEQVIYSVWLHSFVLHILQSTIHLKGKNKK